MSIHSDEMRDARAETQLVFTSRLLMSDPFDLTDEDYEDAANTINEIIDTATKHLHMTHQELKPKLVNLRNFAAHAGVDIALPEEFDSLAKKGPNIRHKLLKPTKVVDEAYREGLLRAISHGRENS
jgi:hypothetical protein